MYFLLELNLAITIHHNFCHGHLIRTLLYRGPPMMSLSEDFKGAHIICFVVRYNNTNIALIAKVTLLLASKLL